MLDLSKLTTGDYGNLGTGLTALAPLGAAGAITQKGQGTTAASTSDIAAAIRRRSAARKKSKK
jgi:hypothetical protein